MFDEQTLAVIAENLKGNEGSSNGEGMKGVGSDTHMLTPLGEVEEKRKPQRAKSLDSNDSDDDDDADSGATPTADFLKSVTEIRGVNEDILIEQNLEARLDELILSTDISKPSAKLARHL